MCTAISFKTKDHYFGRNLDLEYSFSETVTITPRNYPLKFRHQKDLHSHYAMIGTAYVPNNYPLYYEATNEIGLSMAGLNFPGQADYKEFDNTKDNIAPFEFISWILGQCASVKETIPLLQRINLLQEDYSVNLRLTPMHWLLADKYTSLTLESVSDGFKIYHNPVGVLTNNRPYEMQLFSNDKGTIGMPGDWTSQSRFTKASFVKTNSVCGESEEESISQFFHILGSVEHQRGSVDVGDNLYEITIYSSCCNTNKGIYYYKTYENSQITAVNMHHEDLNSSKLYSYPLRNKQQIYSEN